MIKLTKDKITYITDHYNPEYEKYEEKEVDCLYSYLNEMVELSDDFTLEDLFKILEREHVFMETIFTSHLGRYPLQLYIDDIKKPRPVKDDEDEDELCCLELKRFGEHWSWGDIDLFIDFSGLSNKTDWSYAVEFSPLNELKHLPLRLNEDFEISEGKTSSWIVRYLFKWWKGTIGRWKNPYSYIHVEGKTKFSVYELISTVLYEISFAGEPVERDAKIAEIVGITKEAMEQYGDLDSED